MNPLPDVSNLSASEVTELMTKCSQRLDELRQQHMEQAELLGLHCALPAPRQRKPRRNSSKEHAAE